MTEILCCYTTEPTPEQLRRLENMTLLVAVVTDDSILLGADTSAAVSESFPFDQPFPVQVPTEKFLTTGLPTVMWGYSGISPIAAPIITWAAKRSWHSWAQLQKEVKVEYQKSLRTVRKSVVAAGGDGDDPVLTFGVMFAGYIAREPGIFLVYPKGLPHYFDMEKGVKCEPGPFGGGQTLALASWLVLKAFHPESKIETAEDLGRFMDAICKVGGGLDGPADLWCITADGSAKVDRIIAPSGQRWSCQPSRSHPR